MADADETVFVTGATGFIGRAVVERLLGRGWTVRALVRPGSERKLPRHDRVEACPGDVRGEAQLLAAARGASAAVHLVGILRETPDDTFDEVHVGGTENVIRACRAGRLERLVHMSALGVARGPEVAYLATKRRAESRVRNSGLDWTILRPSVVHGPTGDFMIQMARMVARPGPVPLVGTGRAELQPVWVEDLAELVARILERPVAAGRIVEVGGPEVLLLREFYQILSRVLLGRRTWLLPVPTLLVKAGARLARAVLRDPPITPDELRMLLEARPCSIRPLAEHFDLEPAPFEETLEAYADALREAAGIG